MKRLIRNIKLFFLLRKVKAKGVFKWGYRMSGIAFHNPFQFADDRETEKIQALIRLGKIKPNGETHHIPHSREMKEFDQRVVYSV
jgi:hypothetical protein